MSPVRPWAARRSPGAELARVVMQPTPLPVEVVARAVAAVDRPAEARERLTFHGAWGHAHRVTESLGLPVPGWLADEGAGRRAWALRQHLRTLHDLVELRRVLDAAGVPWLAFKGPTLSAMYAFPDVRGYTDLDVLVDPADLGAAVTALLAARWPFVEASEDLDRRPPVGELHLTGPAGTPVDLHWHLVYRPDHPSRGRLDPGSLVAGRRLMRIGATDMATLPLPAHIVYVCAHAAAGGGNRLRWLTDVAHLASRASTADWSGVVETSRAWGVARSVALVLSRAVSQVDAPVPSWVTSTLTGRRARTLAALVELADPLPGSREHRSTTAALARVADHPLGSAAGVVLGVRSARRRRDPTPPRHDLLMTPGGVDPLLRFVDAVTTEAGRPGSRSGDHVPDVAAPQ